MIAGRYSLDREIGRGGMGAVWLGRDEVLGRQVALKRIGLLPGADRTDLARAEREARLGALLNNPHVVAVFDVVTDTDSDARWLVMEYVDGLTLAQLVRAEGPLAPDDAAPLLWQAADALVAAHAAGIAHRDVKPSNIMVDRNRRVKLTDFGIARITADPSLTQTGMVTGSPAYLAPEVATGGRGDQAADVWSLGATTFFVLSGRAPYDMGDNVLGGLYRIVHEEPPRLDHAGWLAPLLESTMVKDPSRRWSMVQVRDFLASHTGQASPARSHGWVGGDREEESTRVLGTAAGAPLPAAEPVPEPAPEPEPAPAAPMAAPPAAPLAGQSPGRRRPPAKVLLGGLVLLLALVAVGLYAALSGGEPAKNTATKRPSTSATSKSPAPTKSATPARPTAQGMASFIRDYVSTVSADPNSSWRMLTPKFQRESGGLDKYRSFWGPATNGRVLSITADPSNLTVSYQVHFDHFHNGPGPTVLDLKFDGNRYFIDGEHSKGFVPSG